MDLKTENTTFFSYDFSEETKNGLAEAGYRHPTEIQKESIDSSLNGYDILAAAKTGSGKTIAFVIPILEKLFKEKWSKVDGLGALIITPTRELAYQIYEVIKKVGKFHDFSLALVVGGKDLKFEWNRLHVVNILISTPGRLLHHLDNNSYFSVDNLKILVLDEADRILDMGFEKELNAIIEHLPKEKQTLLFSATQTKSVKQLARLSLKNPVYISIDEDSKFKTPENLVQSYIVCELHDKLNVLWSFLKSHLHYKIIVFFSTCKQTNFIYELFKNMKLNTTFLALYGTLHQLRRMDIYDEFCRRKNAILFCTDIASRGLDFPDVNWVIQFDCPEDTKSYIHRVGRTARYKKGGESLLLLLPSEEEAMLEELKEKKIPINEIQINPSKIRNIQERAAALLARDVDLKQRAQRCFKTYLKSVYFMKNKLIFDIKLLDFESYSHSLGLEVSPRLRFFEKDKEIKEKMKEIRLKNKDDKKEDSEISDELVNEEEKIDSKNNNEDDNDDFMILKRKLTFDNENVNSKVNFISKKKSKLVTKQSIAKKLKKRNLMINQKKKFDEESEEEDLNILNNNYDLSYAKKKLEKEDNKDKLAYKTMMKQKQLGSKNKVKVEKELKTKEEIEFTNSIINDLPDPDNL